MAIDNILQDSWQGYSHGEVEQGLKALLMKMLQDIENGGIPEGGISVDMLTTALKNAINNAVPNTRKVNNKRLNGDIIIGAGDINDGDMTLTEKLQEMLSRIGGKANDADVVKSISVNGTPQTKQNGNVNISVQDGEDGITPHIGQDGYWYIGSTSTGVKAQGAKGDSGVASGDEVVVVNDFTGEPELEEGQVAVLGADLGKAIKELIDDAVVTFEIEGDTLIINDKTNPIVKFIPSSIHYTDTVFGQTASVSVVVIGRRLSADLVVAITGDGFSGTGFTNGAKTLSPDVDGSIYETLTIVFSPTVSTGTAGQNDERNYTGVLTATYSGTTLATASVDGTGVTAIVPSMTAQVNDEDVASISLKGVTSDTDAANYSDAPSKTTLHIKAKNITNGLTLALTTGTKFTLSKNSLTAEEALEGEDVVVSYVRQSAATATDDTDTLTISCADVPNDITIALSGATGVKDTTSKHVVAKQGDMTFLNYNNIIEVAGRNDSIAIGSNFENYSSKTCTGTLNIPTEFYDQYGYKYVPKGIYWNGFKQTSVENAILGNVTSLEEACFNGCASLETVVGGSLTSTADNQFKDCTSLKRFDCNSIKIRNYMFSGCTALETFIVRRTDGVGSDSFNERSTPFPETEINGNSVYYYVDSHGENKQKKLYVPQSLVTTYQSHARWGKFDVHSLDELSE